MSVPPGGRLRPAAVVLTLLAGCGPAAGTDRPNGEANRPDVDAVAADLAERAASEPIPASFALGRRASEQEIAQLDIHIMPDGRGLPEGSGTVAAGAALYAGKCGACHGFQGEGTPLGAALIASDPQVGFSRRVVGHYWPYATTAFDYIRRAMPWDAPGTLSNDEVYSVVAFILARNGVIAEDAVLDADGLRSIEMPALDRFVMDDRMGTNRVR